MINKLKILKEHEGFLKYFKNTSWLFAEKILRMVVGLFVSVWIARYLGPEQYGLFSYAQSFVGLFTAIASLGLDGIVVRELIKGKSRRIELIGTAFWLKLMGAVAVLMLLAVVVNMLDNDKTTNVLIFIIASATIFQSFNVVDFYFQSRVESRYVVYANMITLFISSIIKITLIMIEAPLVAFAWVVLFDSFVLACGYLYFYLKNTEFGISDMLLNKKIAFELLNDSKFIIFSSAVLMIQARIDQVMINNIKGSIEVGYYSVALRLIESFGFLPMILKQSLYPAIENAKQISDLTYKHRFMNYYRLSFLFFLITALPIFLFAENIIIFLFGNEYHSAGILLSLMASRLFFTNMGVARGSYILSENLMKFSFLTMILGTITNIVLNYLWIPDFGARGAIIATIVSFFVTIFAVDIFYHKTRKNVIWQFKSFFTFYKLRFEG